MLFAYVDESGIHDGATATLVGGLIGTMEQWSALDGLWRSRLDRDNVGEFHATKCRGGHGEFHAWRPDFARMDKLYSDLAVLAEDFQFQPVSGSVLRADWDRLEGPRLKARFPSTYSFCFELCLYHIYCRARDSREQVTVIYASQPEFNAFSSTVVNAYIENEHFNRVLISIAPRSPRVTTPLQMADMLAFELYHMWHSKKEPKRPKLELLPRTWGVGNGFYYDYDSLVVLERDGISGFLD